MIKENKMDATANQAGGNQPNQNGVPAQQPQAQPAETQQSAPAPQLDQTEDVRNRTREQYEKLIESNRKLNELNTQLQQEIEARKTTQQPKAPQQPQVQPAQQVEVDPQDFVELDPVTGERFLNGQKMQARMREIEERAIRAESAIKAHSERIQKEEMDRQNREAFSAYPELEPGNEKFDPEFHRHVRGVLLDSFWNKEDYGGHPMSFKEAGDFVKKTYAPTNKTSPQGENNEPAGESAAPAGNDLKAQASAQVMSQPQNAPQQMNSQELEELRWQTRTGNVEALAARLVATDHSTQVG